MSDVGDFIDAALRNESNGRPAEDVADGSLLRFYGTSVGAIRGTVRDALQKFPIGTHDEITALSAELWAVPVFERRLASVVLLQVRVGLLRVSDLTRIEGFVRGAANCERLLLPLIQEIVVPLFGMLDVESRNGASGVLDRWSRSDVAELRLAASAVAASQA